MAKGECCANCAYADKSGKTMWCPFHDEPINSNLVCDDFLDEYQSPQWLALAGTGAPKVGRFTGKDIAAYVLSIFFILLSVLCFLV